MRPINERVPLIVVKRCYYDEFAAGRKTIEYRRYGRMFTERTFYPGRYVRIAYSYNVKRHPGMIAWVQGLETAPFSDHPVMAAIYPDMRPHDRLALIHLEIVEGHRLDG